MDFTSRGYGRDVSASPVPLGDRFWIAEVEGLYDQVEVTVNGSPAGALRIPDAVRC